MANKGITMSVKANGGNYVPLYPQIYQYKIIGWDRAHIIGPYTLVLSATGWINGQQTLALSGITSEDVPQCLKILSGTQEEQEAQDVAYAMLDPLHGIESLNNQVRFTCTSEDRIPNVDITVQVHWFK